MITEEFFSRSLLKHKYPGLEAQIDQGDFKILVTESGSKIVRFPNTAVFAPNEHLISLITTELFHGHRSADVVFRCYGVAGIEITTR